MRRTNRGLTISNRVALLAVLALAVAAVAGSPGGSSDADEMTAGTPVESAEPAPAQAETVAGKPRFRLLLLRRG